MYRIGDFSRLTQVSVRMLRYYDEQGLLKPASVDRFTDYRYYSADQLPRLNRILALRDLGFTTDQIGGCSTTRCRPSRSAACSSCGTRRSSSRWRPSRRGCCGWKPG